jgi:hypothetical protein
MSIGVIADRALGWYRRQGAPDVAATLLHEPVDKRKKRGLV